MKRIVSTVLAAVCLLAVFVSCANEKYQKADTPEKLFANYEKAMNDRDSEGLKVCILPENREEMNDDDLEELLSQLGDGKFTVNVTDVEYFSENVAEVTALVSFSSSDSEQSFSDEEQIYHIDLVDGIWYLEED
ncbi:MAG: hypothetical protein IJM71_05245 [Clostridia bacterium]|nr:hypothetical protein [Clostridia bacterium]